MKIVLIDLWVIFKYFISNVNTEQSWHKIFLFLRPSWTGVDKFFDHLVSMVLHVLNLEVDCFLYFSQSQLFVSLRAHSLRHHLLLNKWSKLMLIFGKMLFWDTDFHHDLLLKTHSDLLNLSHALCNHSEILIKVLISFLLVVQFSVFFEVFRKFKDFFLWSFKWEDKDFLNVLKWGILHVDGSLEFLNFQIKVKDVFVLFLELAWMLLFFVIVFDKTG